MSGKHLIGACSAALLFAVHGSAGVYQIQGTADWEQWTYPAGVLALAEDGSIGLTWIRKDINAVADAKEHLHASKDAGGDVPGGVRRAGSNLADGDYAIDGDLNTWWRPSPGDERDDWWIEVDLGRPALATKVRIIFPDTVGARPFRLFSVYVNDGHRASAKRDIYKFTRIGGATEPNTDRVLEYDLALVQEGAATGEHLVTADTLGFALVHHVRFVAEGTQADAALAEIEVDALGDNIAAGTQERGGWIVGGAAGNVADVIDSDLNTEWVLQTSEGREWEIGGYWFEWDLGATFWVDRLVSLDYKYYMPWAFAVFTSDGQPAAGLTKERVRSNFDYDQLTRVDNATSPRQRHFDLQFPPRKVRYIFYHHDLLVPDVRLYYSMNEYMLLGEGYMAEVEMVSDFLELGGPKSIRRLEWDASLPPGTQVTIRSQTGDTFEIRRHYYHKSGQEITEGQWNKLPSSQKLPVEEIRLPGADWSGWSQVYAYPEELFLSPSPRKYVRLKAALRTDDPQVAPVLRSIALHYEEPLLSGGVSGRVSPRHVALDSLVEFSYLILPEPWTGDPGFDRVDIQVPFAADGVSLYIGGQSVAPAAVEMVGDTLRVDLPREVTSDSVEVRFRTSVVANATEFNSWLTHSRRGRYQGVRPAEPRALTVYVPSVADASALMRNVSVTPKVITPNGDGVNEVADIRFVVVKVDKEPAVELYSLAGDRVCSLVPKDGKYQWDGRDASGVLVAPGAYICRVRLKADIGEQTVHEVLYVAY